MFKKFLLSIVIFLSLFSVTNNAQANSCYDLLNWYDGWSYGSNYKVNINYTYKQDGSYFYDYRIALAEDEWESEFGLFNMKKVSSGGNLSIISDDYGDIGWVGMAYYKESPKRILINEWYHSNYDHYDWTAYERVVIHEMGHTHGLDHTSCVNEIMSNNANRDIYQTNLGDGDRAGIRDKY